jgi:hypothetical protein
MERALIRLKLGAPWLDNGALVRLNSEVSPSSAPACAGARWTAGNAPRCQWLRKCLAW